MIDTMSVQRFLKAKGFYPGQVDGDYGSKSNAASRHLLIGIGLTQSAAWSDARVRQAVEQLMMQAIGAYAGGIDGLNGPMTQIGLEKWQDHLTFEGHPLRIPEGPIETRAPWPKQDQVSLTAFYGEPGTNQVKVESPYPLKIDWDLGTTANRFSCNAKVADSITRAMTKILKIYGHDALVRLGLDQFGGCLNVRKMRNGSAWSTHAWGIAIDWDADRNQLRWGKDRALMAQPEYAPFLDAWEAEGWLSLGRARNFDWMHVQAARL